jgi:5-(carboxyamino)imidazole ribonucleotide synthase
VIGILGSGQLGRFLCLAAKHLGYQTHVFSPDPDSPAAAVADFHTVAEYSDQEALETFGRSVGLVTFEFENVPRDSAVYLEKWTTVKPSPEVLHIAQHRAREKTFLSHAGFQCAPFALITSIDSLVRGAERTGFPAVLKTAGFGYDGKGQFRVGSLEEARKVLREQPPQDWVLEKWIEYEKEVSVLVARTEEGECSDWGVVENQHKSQILDLSFAPAQVSPELATEAIQTAHQIAGALRLVGLLCVEFFVEKNGVLRVNELAPRPHNSGHWTLEGAPTSQFEQQLRAILALELGPTKPVKPTAMVNLMGELWEEGEPFWGALKGSGVVLHLYGKKSARNGRKMGHLTATGSTVEEAIQKALKGKQSVRARPASSDR